MSQPTTISPSSAMAIPASESTAKVDVPYLARDLPLAFFGLKHSKWTKPDLVTIIETLGGSADPMSTKIELYQTIQRRYNLHRVSQRTINALEELGLARSNQSNKSQKQVREAAQEASLRRAEVAREKRAAAKERQTAQLSLESAPVEQTGQPSRRAEEEVQEEDFDYYEGEVENEDQDYPPQPPTSGEASTFHRRTTKHGLNNTADNESIELSRLLVLPGDFTRAGRLEQKPSTLAKHVVKKRKTAASAKARTNPPALPSVVLGTSTAIQDTAVLRRRLELADFSAPRNELSCQVCTEDLDPLLPFQVSVAAGCGHPPEICLACWEEHIVAQVNSKPWDAITCPHADCSVTLGHNDMQRFAPTDVYRRYDRFQTNEALKNTPGYRQCAHEGCGSGAVIEPNAAATYMTCADCKRNTCLGCNHIYHDDQTCDEYRASLVDERGLDKVERARLDKMKKLVEKSEKYLDKKAKTCPNAACGMKIQKTQGCDHMTCQICRHQFCWLCLADYTTIHREGLDRHMPSCLHYQVAPPARRRRIEEDIVRPPPQRRVGEEDTARPAAQQRVGEEDIVRSAPRRRIGEEYTARPAAQHRIGEEVTGGFLARHRIGEEVTARPPPRRRRVEEDTARLSARRQIVEEGTTRPPIWHRIIAEDAARVSEQYSTRAAEEYFARLPEESFVIAREEYYRGGY